MEIDFDDSSYFYYLDGDGDGRIVDKVWCPSFWKEEL